MVDTFKNNLGLSGTDLLNGAILSSDLTLVVFATPSDSAGSAGLSATPPYNILIESELLRVTGVNVGTKTLTVTRGYRGTTAAGHASGVGVDMILTDDALLGVGSTYGTPGLTLGTSNAAGVAASAVRTDATILAFDATAPVTQAFSDAAAAGTATVAARRDHVHGMPASPGGGGSSSALLDYALASDISGLSLPATTWTDAIANQSFTVTDATKAIEIRVGGFMLTGGANSTNNGIGTRLVVDSAGTPTNLSLSGERQPSLNATFSNCLAGARVIRLAPGTLSAAAHTIKLQCYADVAGQIYCRTSTTITERLYIMVVQVP